MRKKKFFILILVSFLAGYIGSFVVKTDDFLQVANVKIKAMVATNKTTMPTAIKAKEKYQLQKKINQVFPNLVVEDIAHSPLSGIYQVIANSEVFYISKNGQYLLLGNLLDLTKDKNVISQTEEIRKTIRIKALNNIPTKEMIIFSPDNVKNVVTIFTDLDCIFCQKFHEDIDKIMALGIEVRYLAFPRQGINSSSYNKTRSIWCADDPKAMFTLAAGGKDVPNKSCDTTIAKQYELGRELNIQGTPTIVFADGTMLTKYMVPEELAKFVAEHKPDI